MRFVDTDVIQFFFHVLDNCFFFSDFSGSNGRRESQGSLSSGASLELGTSGSGRNEVSLETVTSPHDQFRPHGSRLLKIIFHHTPTYLPLTKSRNFGRPSLPVYLLHFSILFLQQKKKLFLSLSPLSLFRWKFLVVQYQYQLSGELAVPP